MTTKWLAVVMMNARQVMKVVQSTAKSHNVVPDKKCGNAGDRLQTVAASRLRSGCALRRVSDLNWHRWSLQFGDAELGADGRTR